MRISRVSYFIYRINRSINSRVKTNRKIGAGDIFIYCARKPYTRNIEFMTKDLGSPE